MQRDPVCRLPSLEFDLQIGRGQLHATPLGPFDHPEVFRLIVVSQAEREHFPADHLGARCEREAHPVLGQRAGVDDGLERQPFEPRAGADAHFNRL